MDNWKNILDEDILKTNISFASVFVMNYECLKEFIIDQIKMFYSEEFHFNDNQLIYKESSSYRKEVRDLDSNIENASLKWFIKAGAISQEDYDTYQVVRTKRNDITHELLKNLNNGFGEEDMKVFFAMLKIYRKIDNWWINEIEIPTSAEEIPKDYNREEVYGGQAFMLSIINEILFGNAGDKYKELLNNLIKKGL